MKYKYATTTGKGRPKGSKGCGRTSDPDQWITGPDPQRRDKYYAYLKHKAQANFRGEEYSLTWEDWEDLWCEPNWSNRGRKITDLCLTRLDYKGPWSVDNVIVCTRRQHFDIKMEQYAAQQRDV